MHIGPLGAAIRNSSLPTPTISSLRLPSSRDHIIQRIRKLPRPRSGQSIRDRHSSSTLGQREPHLAPKLFVSRRADPTKVFGMEVPVAQMEHRSAIPRRCCRRLMAHWQEKKKWTNSRREIDVFGKMRRQSQAKAGTALCFGDIWKWDEASRTSSYGLAPWEGSKGPAAALALATPSGWETTQARSAEERSSGDRAGYISSVALRLRTLMSALFLRYY